MLLVTIALQLAWKDVTKTGDKVLWQRRRDLVARRIAQLKYTRMSTERWTLNGGNRTGYEECEEMPLGTYVWFS